MSVAKGLAGLLRWAAALVLLLVFVAFLLVLRFPKEELKGYCEARIAQLFGGGACTIEEIAFALPPAIKFLTIRVHDDSGSVETPPLLVDEVIITPRLSSLGRRFLIEAKAYDGTLRMGVKKDGQKLQLTDIVLDGLDLGKMVPLHRRLGRSFSGRLSLSGDYVTTLKEVTRGQADLQLLLVQGAFPLRRPVLTLNRIDLQRAQCTLKSEKGMVTIGQGTFEGRELRGSLTGQILLTAKVQAGELHMTGELEVKRIPRVGASLEDIQLSRFVRQYGGGTLGYRVQGTLDRPQFLVTGRGEHDL